MAEGEDLELERLRMARMRELMKRLLERERAKARGAGALDKPVEVRDDNFDEFVKSHPLVVVDFWAPWCGPCLMLAPVIDELAREYAGRVVFGKLNVDENPRTAARFHIMGIPTLLIFKNGQLVDRIVGALPKQVLEARIKRFLGP